MFCKGLVNMPKTFQHQPLLLQSRFNRELSISAMFTDQKSLEICYGKMMGLQTQYLLEILMEWGSVRISPHGTWE